MYRYLQIYLKKNKKNKNFYKKYRVYNIKNNNLLKKSLLNNSDFNIKKILIKNLRRYLKKILIKFLIINKSLTLMFSYI